MEITLQTPTADPEQDAIIGSGVTGYVSSDSSVWLSFFGLEDTIGILQAFQGQFLDAPVEYRLNDRPYTEARCEHIRGTLTTIFLRNGVSNPQVVDTSHIIYKKRAHPQGVITTPTSIRK
jgi:hypothetical protein